MLRLIIFHLLMSLPPSKYTEEAPTDREVRMHSVTNAVTDASEELTHSEQRQLGAYGSQDKPSAKLRVATYRRFEQKLAEIKAQLSEGAA